MLMLIHSEKLQSRVLEMIENVLLLTRIEPTLDILLSRAVCRLYHGAAVNGISGVRKI